MIRRKYETALHKAIDVIFQKAAYEGMTAREIAEKAGLHYQTVRRLELYETRRPQHRTIWACALAVGAELEVRTDRSLKEGKRGRKPASVK